MQLIPFVPSPPSPSNDLFVSICWEQRSRLVRMWLQRVTGSFDFLLNEVWRWLILWSSFFLLLWALIKIKKRDDGCGGRINIHSGKSSKGTFIRDAYCRLKHQLFAIPPPLFMDLQNKITIQIELDILLIILFVSDLWCPFFSLPPMNYQFQG